MAAPLLRRPRWWIRASLRVRSLVLRSRVEQELDDELAFHLDMASRAARERGLGAAESDLAARRAIDGMALRKDECRDARGWGTLDALRQDARHAARGLRRTPVYTSVAVASLALGIGATSALFAIVDAVLLAPLPLPAPERLVWIEELRDGAPSGGNPQRLADWAGVGAVSGAGGFYGDEPFVRTADDDLGRLGMLRTFGPLIETLGLQPIAGRLPTPAEQRAEGAPVVLITERAWRSRWGGRDGVIGTTIRIEDRVAEVIGILPASADALSDDEIWMAAPPDVQRSPRASGFLGQVARLEDGVTLAGARAAFTAAAARLARDHPDTDRGLQAQLVLLQTRLGQEARLPLLVLLGTVALVMLVACLNVAALTLARGLARLRESSLRVALGAGRARLLQLHLVESALLAVAGAAGGLILAFYGLDLLKAVLPPMPRLAQAAIDIRLVGVTAGLALICALIVGLLPAILSGRAAAASTLREGGAAVSGLSRSRWRGALVVGEVAVAVVLLVGASLLTRSLVRLQAVPLGFDPSHTLTFRVPLPWDTDPSRIAAVTTTVLERLQAAPGVRAAGMADRLPLGGGSQTTPVVIRGVDLPKDLATSKIGWRTATSGYFAAIGLPVRRGELFADRSGDRAPRVALVNETFVRTFLGARDPIGVEVGGWRRGGGDVPWFRIVGVVGDLRTELSEASPMPAVYVPAGATYWPLLHFAARVSGEPAAIVPVVTTLARELAPEVTIEDLRSLEAHVSHVARHSRTRTWIVVAFALVALALAGLGLYGLLAGEVAARVKEIGVRLTLGAQPSQILMQTLGRGLRLALLGLALGLMAAPAAGGLLEGLLVGVSPRDWIALVAAFAVLLVIATLASLGPAWRASRIDPNVALRTE